ncbi:extradiol ring-cleavage dioxygenase [Tsuneonella rigui]|uniref:DODA-type extradiol aromatic ring-opening family dioxygenase n=1 Tax=Tsuneonella rigui TaxID=1708790 RepID=UPI000F7E461F|nr:extradiol ring-cleavage dioxygenase [Tsuneonella rigui]
MSEIVLGLGASHSPLLTFGVDLWIEKAEDDMRRPLNLSDGRYVTYADLLEKVGPVYAEAATRDNLLVQEQRCQAALDKMADALEDAAPDALIVIGDDQAELFSLANMPAVSIFYGDEIIMHPWSEHAESMPNWKASAAAGYGMDRARRFAGAPDLAVAAIEGLIAREVDIGASNEVVDPNVAGFGHAYGFIATRLFRGREIPILPVLLNTYFRPNVPSAARAYDIGVKLAETLLDSDDLRLGIIASGGLSHFVTDADLDLGVLHAMRDKNEAHLRSVPREALLSGSSEILNWIMAAGALRDLPMSWMEYIPIYRTPAGSGVGMAFAIWR